MLQSELLWFNKLRLNLKEKSFKFTCVANRIINGEKQTIRYHADDLTSINFYNKVENGYRMDKEWLKYTYGKYEEIKATRENIHSYLDRKFEIYKENREVKINMVTSLEDRLDEWPIKFRERISNCSTC